MKHLLFLLAISTILISCQKEYTPGDLTPVIGDTTQNNTCTTYFPLTTGSVWTYNDLGNELEVSVVNPDSIINGKTFKRLSQKSSVTTVETFSREENSSVFNYVDFGANGLAAGKVLINPLRTNAAVGEKWRDTISINGFTERIEYEMLEKNISYSIDTFKFTDVIHVQYRVRVDLPPVLADEQVQITDVWVAKCIGGIETKTQAFFGGISTGEQDYRIKSYSVK